mmetsp:Transcript_38738/g.75644  ORF Transcript_38738/g.75644 Transcript_38738/m.75644 type:complete len:364 (-) Transcript_38738:105-1196(-)
MPLFLPYRLFLAVLCAVPSKGGDDNRSTSRRQLRTRIYNGQTASPGRYQYFALTENSQYRCGAVLVASNALLTAAHCRGNFFQAGIGKHLMYHDNDYESIGVKQEIPHPEYTGKPSLDNDFMVVILDRKSTVDPVCIADSSTILNVGEDLTVMGFGKTENGNSPTELQETQVQYMTNTKCDDRYFNQYLISDNMMCAFSDAGQDACQGDSGGPLIRRGNDAAGDLLVGIVSWGVDCGTMPGVYSRISSQRTWIEEVVRENGGVMCGEAPPAAANYSEADSVKTDDYAADGYAADYAPADQNDRDEEPLSCYDHPTYLFDRNNRDSTCSQIMLTNTDLCDTVDAQDILVSFMCPKSCGGCDDEA